MEIFGILCTLKLNKFEKILLCFHIPALAAILPYLKIRIEYISLIVPCFVSKYNTHRPCNIGLSSLSMLNVILTFTCRFLAGKYSFSFPYRCHFCAGGYISFQEFGQKIQYCWMLGYFFAVFMKKQYKLPVQISDIDWNKTSHSRLTFYKKNWFSFYRMFCIVLLLLFAYRKCENVCNRAKIQIRIYVF